MESPGQTQVESEYSPTEELEKDNLDVKDLGCSEELPNTIDRETKKQHEDSEERLTIRRSMLAHLSTNEKVFFNSAKDENEEQTEQQKVNILEELLNRSYGLFLAKFGNHLLKEHLPYFDNRNEEESMIVDLHLKQLMRALDQQNRTKQTRMVISEPVSEVMEVGDGLSPEDKARLILRGELLDHLSHNTEAHFRSQQLGEPDLTFMEKREIAEDILDRNTSLFLTRFGTHLLEKHLAYFDQTSDNDSYEVKYYLKQLRKTHCKPVSEVGIKNRRFEAMKKMLGEGSYFCETEMRNRNPLLYEQMVGQFLTADERRERLNNIDTTNITFVNLLLEQMDREAVKKLKKEQEEAEDDAMEEDESSDQEMENDVEYDSEEDNDLDKSLWGEAYTDGETTVSKKKQEKKAQPPKKEEKVQEENDDDIPVLSDAEKLLLMEEFRSNMFSSFLQGRDVDFDYSEVDNNSDYDDLDVQGQDAEEKYFDEESSQSGTCERMSDGEDLLDQFMDKLEPEPTPGELAERINNLTHDEA